MTEIKGISVNKINEIIFFRATSQTTKGMYRMDGPYFIKNGNDGAFALGEQCLRTFEECRTGLPHPEDLTKPSLLEKQDPYSTSEEAKLLKKLKKTHKDLILRIRFDGKIYTFAPYRVINKSAAVGIKGVSLTSDGTPENLGKTLLQAFELCE